MQAHPVVFVVLIGVVFVFALSFTLGYGHDQPTYRVRTAFRPEQPTRVLRACGCKNDWPFATDERLVSNANFAQNGSLPDSRGLNALIAFWGQFIDHDVVLTRQTSAQGVFPIVMVPNPVILNMTRSEFVYRQDGCRELINLITPAIDASTVYGDGLSDPAFIYQLRDGARCQLRTGPGNLLPDHPDLHNEFIAGDPRATEHALLASMHTLWVREHNRLCTFVRAGEPGWTETQVFWKTRQLVIAKIQKITFEEWLPSLFGDLISLLDDSLPSKDQHGASVVAEFTVAAFRFGHTLIPDPIGPFSLPTLFFNRQLVKDMGIDPFFTAALNTSAQAVDNHIVDGLRNFLFAQGEDLVTRNLFRSREVGLPTYETTTHCYDSDPLNGETELFVGLLKEPIVTGSSLPMNLALIIAEQFRRIRKFDPEFYTRIASTMGSRYEFELARGTLQNVIQDNTHLTNVRSDTFFR